jgi:hypothetical protein
MDARQDRGLVLALCCSTLKTPNWFSISIWSWPVFPLQYHYELMYLNIFDTRILGQSRWNVNASWRSSLSPVLSTVSSALCAVPASKEALSDSSVGGADSTYCWELECTCLPPPPPRFLPCTRVNFGAVWPGGSFPGSSLTETQKCASIWASSHPLDCPLLSLLATVMTIAYFAPNTTEQYRSASGFCVSEP